MNGKCECGNEIKKPEHGFMPKTCRECRLKRERKCRARSKQKKATSKDGLNFRDAVKRLQ